MKKNISVLFFLLGIVKVSFPSQCIQDDRTLTERLFQGKCGTIFTCKVLTFYIPEEMKNVSRSDGSIGAIATAEIKEIFFGNVDSNIVTLYAGNYLAVGKEYIIYTGGSGHAFGFGGMCDRLTKAVTQDANYEIQTLKKFSEIFKMKMTGEFIFKNSHDVIVATGKYENGNPIETWKHFYNNGKLKAEYDLKRNITTQFASNGFIKTKDFVKNKRKIYESYSEKVNGQLKYKVIDFYKTDTDEVSTFFEYYDNGKIKNIGNQELYTSSRHDGWSGIRIGECKEYFENGKLRVKGKYIKNLRCGVWKWYNEDGKLKNKIDYKKGEYVPSLP